MVQKSTEFVKRQIREHSFLGKDGLFVTIPELPEFCWTELIVNAIVHRDYNITGTDIQIKMFDDHMTVESPGQLPGLVRPNNMREMHFSRNPKIIEFLHVYECFQLYAVCYVEKSEVGCRTSAGRASQRASRRASHKLDRTR